MKKDDNNIYCAFCGSLNNKEDKKCSKCNKNLNPRNHLFREFLKDHFKDDVKGNIEDGLLEIIETWIRTHLFGIGLTALIGVLGVTIALNELNIKKNKSNAASYKTVDKPFTLKVFCEEKELTDKIRICDEGYTLEGDLCVARYQVNAKAESKCPEYYHQVGNSCISNYTTAKQEDVTCSDIPAMMVGGDGNRHYTLGTVIDNKICYAKICHELPGTVRPESESECSSVELAEISKTSRFYCNNYTDENGDCRDTTGFVTKYRCDNGKLNGTKCDITENKDYYEDCPDGTTYDEECKKCLKGGA